MKDYSLKINNIYNEKKNELFNYIFYFCRKNLTFDFLIPYKSLNNIHIKYQIILVNTKKNQSFVTKLGEFQLLSP